MSHTATDLFSLGSAFSPQSSSTRNDGGEIAQVLAADGDVACEASAVNVIQEYSAEYKHCGTSSGVNAGLDAVTTAPVGGPLVKFGCSMDSGSKALTELELTLNNKDYPVLRLTGHTHMDGGSAHANNHTGAGRTFDIGGIIPDAQGQGISMPLFTSNDAISISSAGTVTEAVFLASLEHMDSEQADGDTFRGTNRTCRVELRLSGFGAKSTLTIGSNWTTEDWEDSDSNQEDDSFNITLYQNVDAN